MQGEEERKIKFVNASFVQYDMNGERKGFKKDANKAKKEHQNQKKSKKKVIEGESFNPRKPFQSPASILRP